MPTLRIDLEAIRHNALLVADLCRRAGVRPSLVTKGVLGDPTLVGEVLACGLCSVADSRLGNIRRMREAGLRAEFQLMRVPAPAEAEEVVALADLSYHSELVTLRAVAAAAEATGREHRVVLMVDVGDRREGFLPGDVLGAARAVLGLGSLRLTGLGMNVGCVSGVLPSPANLGLLAELAADVEERLGVGLDVVSGGSSSSLALAAEGRLPARVNHLRVGTAVWLGDYNAGDDPIPGARQDTFEFLAPVVEVKWKPSLPCGEVGVDSFGRRPVFEDRGPMLRVLLGAGRQDVWVEGLRPRLEGLRVLTASSDYIVLDATACPRPPQVGEELRFGLRYPAMLFAMQAVHVRKESRAHTDFRRH